MRRVAGVLAALVLCGCATRSDGAADFARICAAQGLTPGTNTFVDCMERQHLQQQMDLERIRQAREAARGSSKL